MGTLQGQSMKDKVDEFLGSRMLDSELEKYLLTLRGGVGCTLYRGMNFPIHLIKEGQILEEWHCSSHWSKKLKVAHNFAYDGYLNEEHAEELGEDAALLKEYGVAHGCDLFKQTIFKLANNTQGIDTHKLTVEYGLSTWAKEEEVTFIGTDFLMKSVSYVNGAEPYYLVEVEEIR